MPRFQRSNRVCLRPRGAAPSQSLGAAPLPDLCRPVGTSLKGEADLREVCPVIPARGCRCTAFTMLPHVCLRHRGNCNASRMDAGLRVQNGFSAETAIKDSQGDAG